MRMGGTFLGSNNKSHSLGNENKIDATTKIIKSFKELQLDALIGIGGDGSLKILRILKNGIINSMFLDSAVVSTGHVKVTTKGYKEESQLLPNDLALLGTKQLIDKMAHNYQDYFWTPRITFAGLLDVPDENGETQAQGPVFALGIDFLSPGSRQIEIWELERRL